MNEFNHISLPNPGVTTGILPNEIYDAIMSEVEEISSNWDLHSKKNSGLVGNIEKQYELLKSIFTIEPYLNEMCKSYTENWNFYRKNEDFKITQMWVNFQQKHEFNPVHHHNEIFSFVSWLKIPYNIEEELNASHTKETNAKAASTFQFLYPNILGQLTLETLYVSKDWERRIVLFPSHLSHCVYPFSTSDDYRISISGNLI
tara:strand:+ start:109 stop:714 length:606 start_codon:yes stop_codon:yes gene_type:complete